MSEVDGTWLHYDERVDVLASLAACRRSLTAVELEPGQWKWAIVSLHSALTGAMACHLSGSAELGALSAQSARAWLDWDDRDRRGEIAWIDLGTDEMGIPHRRPARKDDHPPERYLADAKELFKRLHNPHKRIEGGAGSIVRVTIDQRDSFRRLHDLRNKFSHFTVGGWSIELSGIPGFFNDILDVIGAIAADFWAFRHMAHCERVQLDALLEDLRTTLHGLALGPSAAAP